MGDQVYVKHLGDQDPIFVVGYEKGEYLVQERLASGATCAVWNLRRSELQRMVMSFVGPVIIDEP